MGKSDNLATGAAVEALVNDYGPSAAVHPDRIIDLSSYAFEQIANKRDGIVSVRVDLITGY